jgi:preprotein translocase subunit SecY
MKKYWGSTSTEWRIFGLMCSIALFISFFNNKYGAFFLFGGASLIVCIKIIIYCDKQEKKEKHEKKKQIYKYDW